MSLVAFEVMFMLSLCRNIYFVVHEKSEEIFYHINKKVDFLNFWIHIANVTSELLKLFIRVWNENSLPNFSDFLFIWGFYCFK